MNRLLYVVLSSHLLLLTVEARTQDVGSTTTQRSNAAVQSSNQFAFQFYRQLAREKGGENLVFSPYSISTTFAMAAEGAVGETAREMAGALGYPRSVVDSAREEDQRLNMQGLHSGFDNLSRFLQQNPVAHGNETVPSINVASALFGDQSYPFSPEFIHSINDYYRTGKLMQTHFGRQTAARRQINEWLKSETENKIQELIPEGGLTSRTRLVLVNAIYFNADWALAFDEGNTRPREFTLSNGTVTLTDCMLANQLRNTRYAAFNADGTFFDTPIAGFYGSDSSVGYPALDGFSMLELFFQGDELSMVVIAPRSPNGLTEIERKLTAEYVDRLLDQLKPRKTNVLLPKFEMEVNYDLSGSLQEMGIRRAFCKPNPRDGAQFPLMTTSKQPADQLYISKVFHSAFIDVNELGTEAAAATGIGMAVPVSASPPFIPSLYADRPFLFLIRERVSGAILFLGRFTGPAARG